MRPVSVRIMHPEPGRDAGPIERWVSAARAGMAATHARRFAAAGATDVAVISGPPDGVPFGTRLRMMARTERPAGLVILGSGAIPLATDHDLRAFVEAAGRDERVALVNNAFSADVLAIARADEVLSGVPDLATDNALPRWLAESAGVRVTDLRRRWRLAIDVDGPLDLVLLGAGTATGDVDTGVAATRLAAIREVAEDPRAELLVAGRTSAATVAWLERSTASRTRVLIEERGLRTRRADQRPAASVLGALLDRDGPGSLGRHLASLADAAVIDSRVLLAHRSGADERGWPSAEDRFASDLSLPRSVIDPWLRDLTASAAEASIPILLGGHSLVGPGVRLAVGVGRRSVAAAWS
jgi:hypothetical protein